MAPGSGYAFRATWHQGCREGEDEDEDANELVRPLPTSGLSLVEGPGMESYILLIELCIIG